MKKHQLEELIQASYKDGQLDENTVKQISDKMNRTLLKIYINELKKEEKKKMIFVTTPKPLAAKEREKISSLFPKKRLVEQIDPEMIGGIKIVQDDEAYDMNLNQTFRDIIRFVNND